MSKTSIIELKLAKNRWTKFFSPMNVATRHNKRVKHLLIIFWSIYVLCVPILFSCIPISRTPNVDNQAPMGSIVTIMIGQNNDYKTYTIDAKNETLGSHLDRVIQQNNLHCKFSGTSIFGGRYILELDNLIPNKNNNEFIFVLANIQNPIYTGGMNIQLEYNQQIYYDLNFGIDDANSMIIQDVSYLFTIIQW